MSRLYYAAVVVVAVAGCSWTAGQSDVADETTGRGSLTSADLDRFLSVVQSHEGAMIPEFTPPDDDESQDLEASAETLVASFQAQCQKLFDVKRQGAVWQRDEEWAQALAGKKISPEKFAALVRDVSLAIMRVRLESRVDLAKLVAVARRKVDQTVKTMDEIDDVPAAERTREAVALRTRSVMQLGRSVALLEFAEMVRQVPPENAKVIRRYSRQLKPLLPASVNDELLVELKALATSAESDVRQAAFEEEESQ